jgi:hypothetical protein
LPIAALSISVSPGSQSPSVPLNDFDDQFAAAVRLPPGKNAPKWPKLVYERHDIIRMAKVIDQLAAAMFKGNEGKLPPPLRCEAAMLAEKVMDMAIHNPLKAVILGCNGLCDIGDKIKAQGRKMKKRLSSAPPPQKAPNIDEVLDRAIKATFAVNDVPDSVSFLWNEFLELRKCVELAICKFESREEIIKEDIFNEYGKSGKIMHSTRVEKQLDLVDHVFDMLKDKPVKLVGEILLFLENEKSMDEIKSRLSDGGNLGVFLEDKYYNAFMIEESDYEYDWGQNL